MKDLCTKISQNIRTISLIGLVILFTSAQLILIPLVSGRYASIYFTLLMVCSQFTIIAFVTMVIANRGVRLPKDKTSVILCGVFGSLMTICYAYSADPVRTQPVMQTVMSGLRIIPSVIFTKLILKKSNMYDLRFTVSSIVLLLGSIGLTFIPQTADFSPKSVLWISMFTASIIFAALYSIFQERYTIVTGDSSNANETVLIFWTRLIQNIIVASSYWCEYVIGHEHDPAHAFRQSVEQFLKNSADTMILELGIAVYLAAYIVSTYLNSVSTNYSMISSAGAEPIVILFFTIFSSLNTGVHYPWYISLSCVILSLASVYLWVKGEKHSTQNQAGVADEEKASLNAGRPMSRTNSANHVIPVTAPDSGIVPYANPNMYSSYGITNYSGAASVGSMQYGSMQYGSMQYGSMQYGSPNDPNFGSFYGSMKMDG